ncbi:YceI family protein [soil metagenome]
MNDDFDPATTVIDDISGTYNIDAGHSGLGFVARHAMVTKVRGNFGEFEGTATVDTANPENSSVTVTIKTASISTGSADRDGHLVSADFFDAEANPEITFVSTSVAKDGHLWNITGDLTIKGVTNEVTIPFEETGSAQDPWGQTRVGFEGSATISRKDWGLTWNAALETGGMLVSDKIQLNLDISAVKQS